MMTHYHCGLTMKKTIGKGRIYLEIDLSDAATPVMVYLNRQTASATWECAVQTGVLTDFRTSNDVELTPAEIQWLESQEDEVQAAFSNARS